MESFVVELEWSRTQACMITSVFSSHLQKCTCNTIIKLYYQRLQAILLLNVSMLKWNSNIFHDISGKYFLPKPEPLSNRKRSILMIRVGSNSDWAIPFPILVIWKPALKTINSNSGNFEKFQFQFRQNWKVSIPISWKFSNPIPIPEVFKIFNSNYHLSARGQTDDILLL